MLQSTGDEVVAKCPFCFASGVGPDKSGHLYFNTRKQVFHCFRCGVSGSLGMLVKRLGPDALKYLRQRGSSKKVDNHQRKDAWGITVLDDAASAEGPVARLAYDYLTRRGVLPTEMLFYGLRVGYEEKASDLEIAIPIYGTTSTEPLWYQRRMIHKKAYFMPKGVPYVNHTCFRTFGLTRPFKKAKIAVVVEGVFDAMAVTRKTFLPAIATLGTTPPIGRRRAIAELANKVIVLFDPDAMAAAAKLTLSLWHLGFNKRTALRADCTGMTGDPDEWSRETLWAVIDPQLQQLRKDE